MITNIVLKIKRAVEQNIVTDAFCSKSYSLPLVKLPCDTKFLPISSKLDFVIVKKNLYLEQPVMPCIVDNTNVFAIFVDVSIKYFGIRESLRKKILHVRIYKSYQQKNARYE